MTISNVPSIARARAFWIAWPGALTTCPPEDGKLRVSIHGDPGRTPTPRMGGSSNRSVPGRCSREQGRITVELTTSCWIDLWRGGRRDAGPWPVRFRDLPLTAASVECLQPSRHSHGSIHRLWLWTAFAAHPSDLVVRLTRHVLVALPSASDGYATASRFGGRVGEGAGVTYIKPQGSSVG